MCKAITFSDARADNAGTQRETVLEAVGAPIEDQVNGAEGMVHMSSRAASDGSYILTVTFEVGVDADLAQVSSPQRLGHFFLEFRVQVIAC